MITAIGIFLICALAAGIIWAAIEMLAETIIWKVRARKNRCQCGNPRSRYFQHGPDLCQPHWEVV